MLGAKDTTENRLDPEHGFSVQSNSSEPVLAGSCFSDGQESMIENPGDPRDQACLRRAGGAPWKQPLWG